MRQKLLAGPKNGPYTLKEVSYRLNISDATLKRRIKEGKLKAYKSDGKLMVNKPDLEQFINDFPKYNPNKNDALPKANVTPKIDNLEILNKLIRNIISSTVENEQLYDIEDKRLFWDILKIERWKIETIKSLKENEKMCENLLSAYEQQIKALSVQISQIDEIKQYSAPELKLLHAVFDKELSESELDYIKSYDEYLIQRFLIREKIRLLSFIVEGYHLQEDYIIESYNQKKGIELAKKKSQVESSKET